MTPWEKSYETHDWSSYKIPLSANNSEKPPVESIPETELICCGGGSEVAAQLKESPLRFYYDWEQIAVGLDKVYGVATIGRLASDWKSHKVGSLVLEVYAGVNEEPHCTTFLVER